MKAFDYRAPATVSGAVELLAEWGERARPLAGGTDVLVQLRGGRFDRVELLVDVKRIPELGALRYDPANGLTVGAAVACYRIAEHREVKTLYPGLAEAAGIIGGTAIQGRATVGGNLCNSSPSGDAVPALIVLGATCEIAGPDGSRTAPVEGFCTAPGRNVLGRGELLVALHVPPPQPRSADCYLRFIPRHEMDIAVVGAGAWLALDERGTIADVRIALAAVAPTPLLVAEAGTVLRGEEPSDRAFAEAARLAQAAARPISDARGGAEYRRHLVGVLVKRALRGAAERAAQLSAVA